MKLLVDGAERLDIEPALAHFREHGWARVGRVADDEILAALRRRADELMLGERVIPGMFFQHDSDTGRYEDLRYGEGWVGPSLDYRKMEKLERDELFRAYLENPLFARIARAVVGPEVAIYRAALFNKSARGGSPLPWHQDGGSYWGLDREPTLQIWTALDGCEIEAGCVEVFPGSHAAGLATPLGGLIPANIVAARGPEEHVVSVPAAAGEVLLIHCHLWHRSGRNASGRPRRAFTLCLLDAATRCLRKKHAPRQFVRVYAEP
jgi:phytanoyl-CoA hydroxylase